MALTIDHKAFSYMGYAYVGIQAFYDYMTGPASDKYTIVDSYNVGADNCWFVFEQKGGTGWQCWLGGRRDAASPWDVNNFTAPINLTTNNMFVAFSPNGGWVTGVDSPNGSMFSNCPGVNGGPVGQYWLRCSPVTDTSYQMSNSYRFEFTFWNDPSIGFFCFLMDRYSGMTPGNNWGSSYGSLGIFPLVSSFGPSDPFPFIILTRTQPQAKYWLKESVSVGTTSYGGFFLHPQDSASPPIWCNAVADPFKLFSTTTQPNPLTGKYDLDSISVHTLTPGRAHSRGIIHPSCLRQGLSPVTNRETFGDGAWIVPMTSTASNYATLLPWDKSIVL